MSIQDKIQHAALQLFFRYGIRNVTMDDIAKELGISKKTIYQYFNEKDDLVTQLFEVQMLVNQQMFEQARAEAKDPIHEIILITHGMESMMKNINPVFLADLQKFYGGIYKKFQKFKEEWGCHSVECNVRDGIRLGLYRQDLDPEFVSKYRMAQMDMLMFGNYFSFDKISMHKTNELLLDMFVCSISTVKGHKLFNHYKKIQEEE